MINQTGLCLTQWLYSSQKLSSHSNLFWTRNKTFFQKLRVYIATTRESDVSYWSGKHYVEDNLTTQYPYPHVIRIFCFPVCFLFLLLPSRVQTSNGSIKESTNITQQHPLSTVRPGYLSMYLSTCLLTFHVLFTAGNRWSKHWCANIKEHSYAGKRLSPRAPTVLNTFTSSSRKSVDLSFCEFSRLDAKKDSKNTFQSLTPTKTARCSIVRC